MRKLIAVAGCLWALCSMATNITNYPVVTAFDEQVWFLLSSVPDKTNYNLPGNYVAATAQPNTFTGSSNTFNGNITVNGDAFVNSTNPTSTFSNVVVTGSALANFGISLPQLVFLPTNRVPVSDVANKVTNFLVINLTNTVNSGGLQWVYSNAVDGHLHLIRGTYTDTQF